MFVKGDPRINTEGRPAGPKARRQFRETIANLAEKAYDVIEEIMDDPKTSPKERAGLAELVLAYHAGRPVDRKVNLDLTGNQTAGIDPSKATLGQIKMHLAQQSLDDPERGEAIDAEFTKLTDEED